MCSRLLTEREDRNLSKVRLAQRSLDIKLQSSDDDELDLETLTDEFIEETGLKDEIKPEELIDKRIKPNVGEYLVEKIDGREVTKEVAQEMMDDLCDEIETKARNMQAMIDRRVKRAPEREGDWADEKKRLRFVDDCIDKEILCDAANMREMIQLSRVVTTDNNHRYGFIVTLLPSCDLLKSPFLIGPRNIGMKSGSSECQR